MPRTGKLSLACAVIRGSAWRRPPPWRRKTNPLARPRCRLPDERKELRAARFVDIVDGDARWYRVLEIGVLRIRLTPAARINDAGFSLRRRRRPANSLYIETIDIF
jgi:hypothetical protein